MPPFLSLPPEIRFQIYRELRSLKSPIIESSSKFPMGFSCPFGYCSFGFHSRILETNRQISLEAKEVFYGENYWTFFASERNFFSAMLFQMAPMELILPYIRKAHIRFSMFQWLYWESCGRSISAFADLIKKNVREICLVLLKAPALRTVKIIWTETSTIHLTCLPTPGTVPESVQGLMCEVLRPLIGLPTTSELQKSNIMVAYMKNLKSERVPKMELEFSECVDEVIALHRSRIVFRKL